MPFWEKTLITMTAAALAGGVSFIVVFMLGGFLVLSCGLFVGLTVMTSSFLVGGFFAVQTSNYVGRFLDRND